MSQATKSKKNKRWILNLGLLFVVSLLMISFISTQFQIIANKNEIKKLEATMTSLVQYNEEIKVILASGRTDEYIERLARVKLDFCAPDEMVYVDAAGSKK